MASNSDAQRAAWAFIAIITLWRVAMLWANRTDLFVDEAQYWAWGQHLDWGYFSKPPLIGWVIRAVTDVLGSDAAPVVRLAAPLLHA
ncbi:MAG: glycosyl transferase, partial [Pseudomonadota bacterium]